MCVHVRVAVFILLAFSAASNAFSADRDQAVKEYAERSRWARMREITGTRRAIQSKTEYLKFVKRGRINRNSSHVSSSGNAITYPDAKVKKTYVQNAEEDIKRLKHNLQEITPLESLFFAQMPRRKPRAGDAASLDGNHATVFQGISGTGSLINLSHETYKIGVQPQSKMRYRYIGRENVLILLRSPITQGVADGATVDFSGIYWFSGTHQYETATGTNSVLVMEELDISNGNRLLFARKSELRKWTDASGDEIKTGLLESADEKLITITLADGGKKRLRRRSLSETDESYVKNWISRQGDPDSPDANQQSR